MMDSLTIQERIAQSKYAVGDPLLMKKPTTMLAEENKKAMKDLQIWQGTWFDSLDPSRIYHVIDELSSHCQTKRLGSPRERRRDGRKYYNFYV